MRIRTDDEVYRVDAVWLGPPKATFPWRARYVAWGVGIVVFLLVLIAERRMGIGFSFFSTGWAVVITIAVTRVVCSRISHERPLAAVLVMSLRELNAPRESSASVGGAASAARVRLRAHRPRPKQAKKSARPTGSKRSSKKQASRSRQPVEQNTAARKRVRSKEVRGVRSSARP